MVSVIIVNYNTFQITCACIASVIAHTRGTDYEIVIVDNASPDDDPDEFLRLFPSVKLIKSPENGGFAKGNNLGIAHSAGDIILLLNSDTVLTEDSISVAADFLHHHNDIGALSVRLVYPDGKLQHTARKFRSLRNELLDTARPLLMLLPYRKRALLMMNQYFHGDFSTYCDWVSGAFMMFRRQILNSQPGNKLDERFFMYGEDQLWCYQFSMQGLRSFYLADTTVVHIHNASTKPEKQHALLQKMLHLELDLMAIRKGRGLYFIAFSAVFRAKEMVRYYIKILALRFFGRRIR